MRLATQPRFLGWSRDSRGDIGTDKEGQPIHPVRCGASGDAGDLRSTPRCCAGRANTKHVVRLHIRRSRGPLPRPLTVALALDFKTKRGHQGRISKCRSRTGSRGGHLIGINSLELWAVSVSGDSIADQWPARRRSCRSGCRGDGARHRRGHGHRGHRGRRRHTLDRGTIQRITP